MEQLDNALAQLTEKLGVGSEVFVSWLTGTGLDAYSRMIIATTISDIITQSIVVAIMTFIVVKCFKIGWKLRTDSAEDKIINDDFEVAYMLSILTFVIGIVLLVFDICEIGVALSNIRTLVGWYVSPEGMIIQMLLDIIKSV